MLRAVIVGLLCVSAFACKSGSDSQKSQPGVAAGKVIEVTGTVTVRHGDVARPLAAGQTVEGDDTIETGADGHVVIELAHNNAKWELGANKKQIVKDSMAWKLAKSEATAKAIDQETSAAGRPAERSAASNSATAPAETAPSAAATPEAEAVGGAPAPPPPPPAPVVEPKKKAPPKAVKPETAVRERAPAPTGGGGNALADTAGGGPSPHDQVAKKTTAITACLTKDMPEVDVVVTITAAGIAKVTVTGSTPVPARVKSCIAGVIQKIQFTHEAATVKMKFSR